MKTKSTTLLSAVLLSISALAQDVITFRNGNELQVKVKEVSPTTVTYLKYDNLTGPTYSESRSAIFMVKYENGIKDVFSDPKPQEDLSTKNYTETPSALGDAQGNKDLIVTSTGENIKCVIDNVNNTHIYYHIRKQYSDTKGIIQISQVISFTKNAQNINGKTINGNTDDEIIEVRKYGGPRIGMTFVGDGAFAQALSAEGKRNCFTLFGWQLEKRVFTLKNGASGMLEFVPMIGGLDIGKFIPSVSALVGIRAKNGFEFGAGPNLAIYYGKDFSGGSSTSANLGVVIATGMSVKSGKVNFPINIAVVPSVTKQADIYDRSTNTMVKKQYQTGIKVSLIIGFNNRKS